MVKAGYKQTEIGVIPEDWEVSALSEITLLMTNGFVGTVKTQYTDSDEGILYIQGYNVEENTFNFNGIKRVTLEFHNKHLKSCLREGDLLTVQTGDVGLTTIVPKKLEGSNCHALIITRFKPSKIEPKFYAYYLNSSQGRLRLKEIEIGTTMKHINVGDMLRFFVPIPPSKEEQKAIAKALSDTDALITALEDLIAKKEAIKQGTMQQLLTGKKRLEGFNGENRKADDNCLSSVGSEPKGLCDSIPVGWEEKRLGDFLDFEQPTKYLVKDTEYSENSDVPVLTAGKTFILGYTNEDFGIFNNLPVIIFDDFTTASKFVSFPFKAKSSAMKMLIPKNSEVNLRFIYEIMQQVKFQVSDHKRHWIGEFQHMEILVPPTIQEQQAIAQILSDMDSELEAFKAKLSKTKAIKEGMMSELLTGKTRLKGAKDE